MQDPGENIKKLVESDERIKAISKEIDDYKSSERARIEGIREKVSQVSAEIRKLTNKRNGLKRQLKINRGPLRRLDRKIRTRRNAIINTEKNKSWRAYSKLFQVRKNKLKV
tara:strand:- start:18110 stop:18442 length:333 start_codon:yes stop_codon:yes gene_type:complete